MGPVRTVFLFFAAFLACSVEMVEALTIVLAVGVTRGWRSALAGVGAATLALGALVAALGPALTRIPIDSLRLVVGALLLVFGLQWLRKAILRASGYKALHDEDAIYREELDRARQAGAPRAGGAGGLDGYAFTVAFKGVFLEGTEVAFIVLTFGTSQHDLPLAAVAASVAIVLVGLVGVAVHAPLSRVPENTMKYAVGVMLTTFGTFWSAEGAGVHWPGSDASIVGVLAFTVVVSFALVAALRRRHRQRLGPTDRVTATAA